MNILFLTIGSFSSIEVKGIYPDLLRQFRDHGDTVYSLSPLEKRLGRQTELTHENGHQALKVQIGNITQCGLLEKGISTVRIEGQFLKAIKTYFRDVKFDLVLYSTPPITFAKVIEYVKKRDHARTYLLLKDIFPQNAADLGMLKTTGVKSFIYKYFRHKEKKLYAISAKIGCMSPANRRYVLEHNPEISPDKVEVCPNCIDVQDMSITSEQRTALRQKYDIPLDKKVFVYGGNLGKPQGIPFIIECLKTQLDNTHAFFLIVGDGTEFPKLQSFFSDYKPSNMRLLKRLPKEDYDRMIAACDVGMIFLDYRFTIPNFPSRLLAYMQAGLPILACTDTSTDIGQVITEGHLGWWCPSNSTQSFAQTVEEAQKASLSPSAELHYLQKHYSAKVGYDIIQAES